MKSGWSEAALREVATIVRRSVKPTDIVDGTLYVGLENIERDGAISDVRTVSSGELASAKFAFAASDILYGKLRPNLGKIARPTFAGVCSTDILPIAPGSAIDRDYLAHFLARPEIVQLAADRATGANLPRISPTELQRFRVVFPPLVEQRRIARTLDAAERLRTQRLSGMPLFSELRRATFLEATLHPSKAWPTVEVADLADKSMDGIRTGPFGSQLLHREFVTQGIPVLGIDNAVTNRFLWGAERYITDVKYQSLRRYTVHPGDVLITIMGTCGRAAVVPDDIGVAINTKHLCCISLDRSSCLPEFLHAYFLEHPVARRYLKSRAKGAIMAGLNMGIIKELPVTLPPIQVQRELVSRLRAVDRLCTRAAKHSTELNALLASLQHHAFNGEL